MKSHSLISQSRNVEVGYVSTAVPVGLQDHPDPSVTSIMYVLPDPTSPPPNYSLTTSPPPPYYSLFSTAPATNYNSVPSSSPPAYDQVMINNFKSV